MSDKIYYGKVIGYENGQFILETNKPGDERIYLTSFECKAEVGDEVKLEFKRVAIISNEYLLWFAEKINKWDV